MRRAWPDAAIAAILFVSVSIWVFKESADVSPSLFGHYADDVWFQADAERSLENFIDRRSDHFRTEVHPLSSLILNSYVTAVGKVWRGPPLERARRAMALLAGLWSASLFALLRLIHLGRLCSLAFTLLGVSSAAFLFWFTVPETYGAGSLTILFVLIGAAIAERRGITDRWLVALSCASLSITVTNWMAGLALAVRSRPWKRALKIALLSLAIVFALALMQKHFFPRSRIFLWGASDEGQFVNPAGSGTPLDKLRVLLLDSLVAPQVRVVEQASPFHDHLSMQLSSPGSGSVYGISALAIWILLLIGGTFVTLIFVRKRRLFASVLGLIVLGQIALHLVYGEETFLYVLHIFPCLIALAAASATLRHSAIASTLAVLAAAGAWANNQQVWRFATAQVVAGMNEREKTLLAESRHPELPWPRENGHVVLGLPGSPLTEKSYHEPGGSFSPSPGSFGVSFWITAADGRLLASSETISLAQIKQRYVRNGAKFAAAIETSTPYFHLIWARDPDTATAQIEPESVPAGSAFWMVLRSIGPAGAPVKEMKAADHLASVGDGWRISIDGAALGWSGGDEQAAGIKLSAAQSAIDVQSPAGWAYLAARLDPARHYSIQLTRNKPHEGLDWLPQALWSPAVPDSRFVAAAYAEQAQILMGLTDKQTRPGEPLNYTADWVRDGAITVAALARAGQTEIARSLSTRLAEKDFFGGFGAEGDAPGLALWALGEVSNALGDQAFDRSLLPHVRRKLGLIEHCLDPAAAPLVVPEMSSPDPNLQDRDRPCERSRLGLAVGRMDGHYPILYVNAMDYAGLVAGARIARRANDESTAHSAEALATSLAKRWLDLYQSSASNRLKTLVSGYLSDLPSAFRVLSRSQARNREFMIGDNWLHADSDDRTFISALWPSGIGLQSEGARQAILLGLEKRWNDRRFTSDSVKRHPRTSFDMAEAHQWLLSGRPDRANAILNAYYVNDVSPGLFAWWEGEDEENSGNLWANLRGWLKPHGVSPHYWTAAEALALQMDFLTYVTGASSDSALVLGMGVPATWRDSQLDSGWILTRYGPTRWRLDNGIVTVQCECRTIPRVELAGGLKGLAMTIAAH